MGRAARQTQAPAPGPDSIQLEPADYWKLRTLMREVQVARDKAARIVAEAAAAHDAHATVLTAKYPALVLGEAAYRTDDATCTLVRQPS